MTTDRDRDAATIAGLRDSLREADLRVDIARETLKANSEHYLGELAKLRVDRDSWKARALAAEAEVAKLAREYECVNCTATKVEDAALRTRLDEAVRLLTRAAPLVRGEHLVDDIAAFLAPGAAGEPAKETT